MSLHHQRAVHRTLSALDRFVEQIRFTRSRPDDEGGERRDKRDRQGARGQKPARNRRSRRSRPCRPEMYRPQRGFGVTVPQAYILCSEYGGTYLSTRRGPDVDILTAIRNSLLSHTTAASHHKGWFSVIWDSGASLSVSPHREDFVGPIHKPPPNTTVQGLGKNLRIAGIGHVAWSFHDTNGMLRTVKVPA